MNKFKRAIQNIFSKQGRMNRLQFLLSSITAIVIIITCLAVLISIGDLTLNYTDVDGLIFEYNSDSIIIFAFIPFISVSLLWFLMSITKRLHDFNASGWWIFVVVVLPFPPALLAIWLLLLLYPGSPEMNDFDPVI